MQPVSKGGYIVVERGGDYTFDCVLQQQLCCTKPTLGGLGACSPRKLDSLRAFLRHSDSHFWADLVAIFT